MPSDNVRGAALMAAAMTAFTVNDACMKALSDDLPLSQALFLRGVATTLILGAALAGLGLWPAGLVRRDWGLMLLRSAAEVLAAWLFLTALFNMPLANVSAILQALPLAVTLTGALIFREPVGWRRLSAIGVGFLGVLLIVRPGAEGFTVYSLYALASVAAVTVRDLAARRMSARVPSLLVALSAAAMVTAFFGARAATIDWAPMGPAEFWQLAGATGFVVVGYVCSVAAMRAGEIGFVAPFRYVSLLVALVLGFVVFGDWPRALTLVGAAVVVGTGLFTLYRERNLPRNAPGGLRVR